MVGMNFEKNKLLLEEAKKFIPIGAQTYSKSFRYFVGDQAPFFTERGKGAYLYDVDGNKYLDFICSLGATTLGYNLRPTNKAIVKQLKKGTVFSTQSPTELELAKKIIQYIPWAEATKFLKNGSDATSTAIKLARAYTSKDIILMSGYHGMDDWSIGTTENHQGVPEKVRNLTDTFLYNDIKSITEKLELYKNNVAAVILEPIQGNGPDENYLETLKKLSHQNGALLIFDEVVSGFRYALGGASELYGVHPDLAAFGKGIANGMPISVVLGKKEILKMIEKNVFVSTTFGGETLSIASALATVDFMVRNNTAKHINHLGKQLWDGFKEIISNLGIDQFVYQYGLAARNGIMFKDFNKIPALFFQSYYQKRLLNEGILAYSIFNFMHAHKEKHIKYLLDVSYTILSEIKEIAQGNKQYNLDETINPIFNRNK